MRVVHAPSEIAGQMGTLCHGLRKLGLQVNGYNWFRSYIGYSHHIVNTDAYELSKIIDPLVNSCDIFHFHNGNSMLVENKDVPRIAEAGRKMVMHHWGSDVRTTEKVSRLNPYSLPPGYLTDAQIHNRLEFLSKYIDTALVQDYEVYPYVQDYYKNVEVLPLACNVESFVPDYPRIDQKNITIVHAPTNRAFKGSDTVERAITGLGMGNVTFRVIEKMRHEQALSAYSTADIVIDQLLCGSYGMVSVEAMAMGKVVVAFIRDDVKAKMPPDVPIVIATPDTLTTVLKELCSSPERLRVIGESSRAFSERYHNVHIVASQLANLYRKL